MRSDELLEITDTNFDTLALKAQLPVLIDFTAAWCAPCRTIAPHVAALARDYAGRLTVGTCDVDSNAALAALKAGDIDVAMFGVGPEHVPELQKDPRFSVIIGETTNDVILAMNNARKPYADVRVRRAMTHAINKPEVVKGAMFGLGRILGSNVDPLNPYFIDLASAMPYDSGKAKKLLDLAA